MKNKSYPVADVMLESLSHIDLLSRKIKDKHTAGMERWHSIECVRKATEQAAIKEVSFMEAAFNAGKSGEYESFEEFQAKFMMQENVEPKGDA